MTELLVIAWCDPVVGVVHRDLQAALIRYPYLVCVTRDSSGLCWILLSISNLRVGLEVFRTASSVVGRGTPKGRSTYMSGGQLPRRRVAARTQCCLTEVSVA